MKYPSIIRIDTAVKSAETTQTGINGRWVAASPLGFPSLVYRVKAAWLVFTGKADALTWEEGQ